LNEVTPRIKPQTYKTTVLPWGVRLQICGIAQRRNFSTISTLFLFRQALFLWRILVPALCGGSCAIVFINIPLVWDDVRFQFMLNVLT